MVDIIIFAIIALIVATKFYNLLGTHNSKESADVVNLPQKNYKNITDDQDDLDETELKKLSSILQNKVQNIKKINNDFSLAVFIKGAEKAFELIIDALVKGDEKLISQLGNEEVTKEFINKYKYLQKSKIKLHISIVAIISSNITDIKLEKNIANITIKFISEQISYLEDNKEKVISGDKNKIEEIEDKWIFSKDISNNSPIWQLVKTA